MNRRWHDPQPYRLASPEMVERAKELARLDSDFDAMFGESLATIPTPVDVRPDGFVEPGEAELELARAGIDALRWDNVKESTRRRLRDATPITPDMRNVK